MLVFFSNLLQSLIGAIPAFFSLYFLIEEQYLLSVLIFLGVLSIVFFFDFLLDGVELLFVVGMIYFFLEGLFFLSILCLAYALVAGIIHIRFHGIPD